jgi:uncharacterized membrane protein
MAEQTHHEWSRDEDTGQYVHHVSVWINASVETCFSYWSQFEQFPRIMRHITRVEKTGPDAWHWEAKIDGQQAEWDAVMPELRQNEIISWRSVEGLKNSGSVTFTPTEKGCRITVHLMYDPPYGIIGDLVAQMKVNDTFHRDLVEDLHNFKEAVETGKIERYRPAA